MKRQSRTKIALLVDQYPIIGQIRAELSESGFDTPVYTHIHVQKPDTDLMHREGRTILNIDHSFLINDAFPGERGNQWESLYAVDQYHRLIRMRGLSNQIVVKDIFKDLNPDIPIEYLVWVTMQDWYEVTEKYDGDCFIGGQTHREVYCIVYPAPKDMTWQELIEKADQEKKEREEAYLYDPTVMPDLPGIHKALRDGCRLQAFSSGGGLRVASLFKGEERVGYGEHPHIEEALNILDEDFLAGNRPYEEVYDGKKRPHYLTGSSVASSRIDLWVRRGKTFDCWQDGDDVCFQLQGLEEIQMPDWVKDKTESNPGIPVLWKDRNFILKATFFAHYFSGGQSATVTEAVANLSHTEDRDAFMFEGTRIGRGATFWEAMKAAFAAPPVEIEE